MENRTVLQGGMAAPMAAGVPTGPVTPIRQMNMVTRAPSAPMPPIMPNSENMPLIPSMASTESVPVMAELDMPTENAAEAAVMMARPWATPDSSGPEFCGHKMGKLPGCAPLAAGFVPSQQNNPPKYEAANALTRGTLFPGLDLPFMNTANNNNPYSGTPLGEVMALDFTCHELELYLDTHKDDKEAFDMLKSLLALSGEAHTKYEKLFGPISVRDLKNADKFTWLKEPWPWEYTERTGK